MCLRICVIFHRLFKANLSLLRILDTVVSHFSQDSKKQLKSKTPLPRPPNGALFSFCGGDPLSTNYHKSWCFAPIPLGGSLFLVAFTQSVRLSAGDQATVLESSSVPEKKKKKKKKKKTRVNDAFILGNDVVKTNKHGVMTNHFGSPAHVLRIILVAPSHPFSFLAV